MNFSGKLFRELRKVLRRKVGSRKTLQFIVNLEYRKFKGEESQGMLMATGVDGKVILLEPSGEVPEGAEVV